MKTDLARMQNFKKFLKEGSIENGDWMCKTKEDIIGYLKKMGYSDNEIFKFASFNEDGPWTELTFLESMYFSYSLKNTNEGARLPFKIRKCEIFTIESILIDTLFGSPIEVERHVKIDSTSLKSLKYLPAEAEKINLVVPSCITFDAQLEKVREMHFHASKFKSLHNFHKSVKSLRELTFDLTSNPIEECVLSLLLIKDLTWTYTLNKPINPNSKKLKAAIEIVNKHLDEKDLLECKTELIEAGLNSFAKI